MKKVTNADDLRGKPLDAADTPALLLDVDAAEANLQTMAEYFNGRPCKLRPHFKSHKCTTLARRQVALGAVGITCAKLGEAEVLAAAGINDILIANQVVGAVKMPRLVEVARRSTLRVAVDSQANVRELSQAASAAGVEVGLLIEVDVGMRRCGVPPGEPALELARFIKTCPGVRFDGIQAYEGHLVCRPDPDERATLTRRDMQLAVDTRRLIERAGIEVPILSGGGTGTYDITGPMDGIDELQSGSYALMDCSYVRIRLEFRNAMNVLATVISKPDPKRVVLDVGLKGLSCEFGPPTLVDRPGDEIPFLASEEHVGVNLCGDHPAEIGQKLRLIPSHGCTTCNLYRQYVVHRNAVIEDVWPIEGAGAMT
ncbi:MAG: DSD1 family PLP-dependent enzyme [Phycisphaerae bacterium]|nr:DSD1 family PLP-dependent enzyme [Phycisphaerae bacterium]